jgi:hypothetical protein
VLTLPGRRQLVLLKTTSADEASGHFRNPWLSGTVAAVAAISDDYRIGDRNGRPGARRLAGLARRADLGS